MELLSIVVPVYNAEKYLEQCIDSLVRQTYSNKEIILVDDGSTDSSRKICDKYSQKYSNVYTKHINNAGVSLARNIGLEFSKGEYVMFVDSDDVLEHDCCKVVIDRMNDTNSDIGSFGYITEYGNIHMGTGIANIEAKTWKDKDTITGFFEIGGWAWNKIYTRVVIGDCRFPENLALCEDALFSWNVIKKSRKLCYISSPMYHYRYSLSSATKKSSVNKYIDAIKPWELIKNDLDKEKADKNVLKKWLNSYVAWNIKICEQMLLQNRFDSKAYLFAKNNIGKYKNCIKYCEWNYRILANGVEHSWNDYKLCGSLFLHLKCIYIGYKKCLSRIRTNK